jgi:elongation factor Ts
MTVRRVACFAVPLGAAAAKYVHSDFKTATVVLIGCDPAGAAGKPEVAEFAKDCCLHLAAFTPLYTHRGEVDEAYLAEQEAMFVKQVEDMDKPENVKVGIVKGKLNKHLADICFMDQPFVKVDKVSVSRKLEEIAKASGAKLSLQKTLIWRLGM